MSIRGIRFRSARARRLAEKALVRGLSPRQARRLDRLLEADGASADRQAYGRLVGLYRALEGDPPLTAGQNRRILEGVKKGIGAPSRSPAGGWLPRLAPAMAAAVVALVCTLALVTGPALNPDAGFQPRGQQQAVTNGWRVDLRALCVRDGEVQRAPARTATSSPDARCLLSDELQLVLTHEADFPYLLVVGQQRTLDGEFRELWYYPLPPSGNSGEALLVQDEPLGQAVTLRVNHLPGEVRVVGVWSRSPMEARMVQAWLRAIGWEQGLDSMLAGLGRGAQIQVVEQRVMIVNNNKSEVR